MAWLSLILLSATLISEDPDDRPNIVVIMADDIGVEGFGCYGSESYETPHIDALASEGVRFRHAYSQPLCTPSRVKIMTGRSNLRNYVAFSILDPGEVTFARLLRDAGYRTAVTGKWQLHGATHYKDFRVGTGATPEDAGFDRYCLWQMAKLGSRYWGPLIDHDGDVRKHDADTYGPDVFIEFAKEFLDEDSDKPFLLYYPMALPHSPFVPTPQSEVREGKGPEFFADMVAQVDAQVGALVKLLEERNLRDNTLLLFTSDNGTHRSIRSKRGGRTVRGGKGRSTDAGTHVPLVVSWPKRHKSGYECNDLIEFSDVLPTLLEAAETPLPENSIFDGVSFLPQVEGKKGQPREWLFCYSNPRPGTDRHPVVRFARNHRYKLYGSGDFYDLSTDVDEESPLDRATIEGDALAAYKQLQAAIESMPMEAQKLREKEKK